MAPTAPHPDAPGRLILVSNRLPLVLARSGDGWRAKAASGGLAKGLSRPHKETGGAWIGWPGLRSEDGKLDPEVEELLAGRGMRGVALSAEEHERYYTRASNRCIWPLFHYFTEKVHFDTGDWTQYVAVNRRFAEAVLDEAEPGDLVFVQDFHLMLVPAMLRAARRDLPIGFFLHIPFPSSEIFRVFPPRAEVLRGLLGADVVGFHTLDYLRNFRASVSRVLGVEVTTSAVEYEGRNVRLLAQPLGIEAEAWQRDESDPGYAAAAAELEEAVSGRRLILGVERLDYTKGIPERLRAYNDLLATDPSLVDQVVMVQIAVPSRTEAEEYRDLKAEVDRLAGEINGTFGRPGRQPLHYQFRGEDQTTLTALYRRADVALVTPLRDGLNLVAKEYVAARTDDTGVLVLGEFAGAAWELGEALHVNPFDRTAMLAALRRALEMTPEEQAARMAPMRARVREADVHAWTATCLDAIRVAHADGVPERIQGDTAAELERRWLAAERRLLFLDYDGTLRRFTARPDEALPEPELTALLRALAAVHGVELWIVSGRTPEFLATWLGDVDAGFVAEHGAFVRRPGEREFTARLEGFSDSWRPDVERIMSQVAQRVPGSLVEHKPLGLAWHYRSCDPGMSAWQARELSLHLNEVLAGTGLEVLRGDKVVEVRPAGVSKGGTVGALVAEAGEPPDFVFAAGDDTTDESTFRALAEPAVTVLVGDRSSAARYRVDDPEALRRLLADWAAGAAAGSERS